MLQDFLLDMDFDELVRLSLLAVPRKRDGGSFGYLCPVQPVACNIKPS